LDTEVDIQSAVAAHRTRNAQLRERLIQSAVALSESRPVDVHFWAGDQHDAAVLGRELFKKGFLVKLLAPASDDAGGSRWNVEAGALVPPEQILGDRLTEQLVRLASDCGAVYDGWGTAL
jgi:regulator of RNase E activity RraB